MENSTARKPPNKPTQPSCSSPPRKLAAKDVVSALTRAYSYQLLCADRFRDIDAAMASAHMLRQLPGAKPPPGVDDTVWNSYPPVDAATNVLIARFVVTTEPAGGQVWIDHKPTGRAPITAFLAEGRHVVAAGLRQRSTAQYKTVLAPQTDETLKLSAPTSDRWSKVRGQVVRWRGGEEATAKTLGALIDTAGVRIALLLPKPGRIEVWGVTKPGRPATMLGAAPNAIGVGAIVNERVASWSGGPGIDPSQPLLVETAAQRDNRLKKNTPQWWVYVSIVGAVTVGAAFVLASELAEDRQKINVTFP